MFCNKPLSAMIIVICFTFIKLIKFINSTCFPFRSWIYFIWVYFIFFCVISFFLILLLWLIVFFVFASCRIRLPISIVSCTIFATICWFTFFILWKELFFYCITCTWFHNKVNVSTKCNPYWLRCLSINFSRHFTLAEQCFHLLRFPFHKIVPTSSIN